MRRDLRWWSWQLIGAAGLCLIVVSVASAQSQPTGDAITLLQWLGSGSGIVALLAWAREQGASREKEKVTAHRLDRLESGTVPLDRWEDHRTDVKRQLEQAIDRIENLHKSIQAVRRDQLERLHGLSDQDGGV